MHTLNTWRMLPPGGAPIGPAGVLWGLVSHGRGQSPQDALEPLRREFVRLLGPCRVFPAGSGRSALARLFAALRRAGGQRDEVLLPAYASFTLPAAVVRAGCRAVLYDLDPRTLAPDLESLRRALSERTLAVVAAHQFGCPFDLAPLAGPCREAGAVLVDDAAQALGAKAGGRMAGLMGDVGLFSLGRTKPLTAISGGVLVTRDPTLAERLHPFFDPRTAGWADGPGAFLPLRALALWLLRRPALYRLPASLPFLKLGASIFDPNFADAPLTPFQAGLAAYALDRLEPVNRARAEKAAFYRDALDPELWEQPAPAPGTEPIYLRYPVLPRAENGPDRAKPFPPADPACRRLGISPGFPCCLDEIPALRPHLVPPAAGAGGFPGAKRLARRLFTLPTHDLVREADLQAVGAALAGEAGEQRARRTQRTQRAQRARRDQSREERA